MDHAVGVKRADPFCDLQAQRHGRLEVEPALALELLLEGAAADEGLRHVGHTVVLPAVEDGHHMRMLYPGGALDLAGEAPSKQVLHRQLGPDELERHDLAVRTHGLVDPRHAALPAGGLDRVGAHGVARGERRPRLNIPNASHNHNSA